MTSLQTDQLMTRAIEQAQQGQTAFGAVITTGEGEVLSEAPNTVGATGDVTAHAEINALRQLSAGLRKRHQGNLHLFTTCEPCPMCMSAIIFAGITTVYYGATIPQAALFTSQIDLRVATVVNAAPRAPELHAEVRNQECLQLFNIWQNTKK
mgnify:CR=1 FL=1